MTENFADPAAPMSDNLTAEFMNNTSFSDQFDIDINLLQDKLVNATLTPINYVWEVQLYYKIIFFLGVFIVSGILYPVITYLVKYVRALANPITFPYKHVLITGCGTGLGKALVQEIYMKGAYITMVGRDKDKLLKVAQSVDVNFKVQPLINVIVCDITELKEKDVELLLKQSEITYGPIEMVINCAAISKPAMILFSALKFILPIAKRMHQRKTPGRIVLMGDSLASHYAIPGMTPYACSKSAVEQLAFQLKAELEPHEIKVHYFIPPPMETSLLQEQKKMYPLVTRCLMKNQKTVNPDYAAALLMRGISMGQFIINGTWSSEIMGTLQCSSKYIFSVIFAPLAIAIRQYNDNGVQRSMLQQKTLKTISH